MKKILVGLVLLTIFAAPIAVLAVAGPAGPQDCCKLRRTITLDGVDSSGVVGATNKCTIGNDEVSATVNSNWGILCFLNTFNSIIDWAFTIFVVLSVFFVILGAFNILSAGGDAEKVNTGRQYILYAFIGLAVAFVARAIPGIVKGILGY